MRLQIANSDNAMMWFIRDMWFIVWISVVSWIAPEVKKTIY